LYRRLVEAGVLPDPPPAAIEGLLEAVATRYARERGRLE